MYQFPHSSKYTAKLLLPLLSFVGLSFLFQFLFYTYGSPLIHSHITIYNLLHGLTLSTLFLHTTTRLIPLKYFFFHPVTRLAQNLHNTYQLLLAGIPFPPPYTKLPSSHYLPLLPITHLSSKIILNALSPGYFTPSLKVLCIPASKNQLSTA